MFSKRNHVVFGSELLKTVPTNKKICLQVSASNVNAIDFYIKSGAKVLEDWRVAQMDENGINEFLKINNRLK